MPDDGRALVIIPTFNEIENIENVLKLVMDQEGDLDALVVDDGSPDGTAEAVAGMRDQYPGRIQLLRRAGKQGLGTAYVLGFRHALQHRYTFVCEMDADLSHNPRDLPRLIAPARQGEADLVIGSRYIGGVRIIDWPLSRLLLSYGAGMYTRTITGLPVRDVTAGFVCYHIRVLDALDLSRVKSNGYSFQIEMKYRAWRNGFRLKEVPIIFTERTEGQSKMSKAIVREAAFKVWEFRLRDLFNKL